MRLLAIVAALAISLTGCGRLVPDGRSQSQKPPPVRSGTVVSPNADTRQCLARLGAQGSQFDPVPDAYYGAGCSTLGTINLASLQGDDSRFSVSNLRKVSCPLAEAFARWARYGVDRAARQELGSPLARIETYGSYSCRNIAGSGKRSAHAQAQAIDIAAFVLADGQRITLLDGWNGTPRERAFLRVVFKSACKRFGTVLGPDYNAAHANHFHVELGGGGFCR